MCILHCLVSLNSIPVNNNNNISYNNKNKIKKYEEKEEIFPPKRKQADSCNRFYPLFPIYQFKA